MDDIEQLIAARLHTLRKERGLSLAQLAQMAAVSKAMISKIERVESSPTAVVLGRLAAALGVPLAQLLANAVVPQMLRRRSDQEVWRDPDSGYLRRHVSPRDPSANTELVEIELPAAARIAYPAWSGRPYRQVLWLLEGTLTVTYGETTYALAAGDSLNFGVDRALLFAAGAEAGACYLLQLIYD